jgi:hypothetical protein
MTEGLRKRRGRGSLDEAQVRAAFSAYLRFRAALRTETDILAYFDLSARQDEMEAALIVALSKVWQEWKGTSPRTVGTDTSHLGAGKFPFGDWIVDLFKAEGENPPSRYAILKAIRLKR